ncbi:MAG TPA: hypothetical protein VMA33_02190 [Candidatus Tectomicrobia bacterium]|jgi:hypothetical protein|nr:hypothetical protein [Candidatus Tectomicrobia bacterium]
MKYWEIIADRLCNAGWSLGWVSAIDSQGRTIWIVDAHCDDGRRFVVHADEKLTAFVELERQVLTVTFYLASIDAECAGGFRNRALQRKTPYRACR